MNTQRLEEVLTEIRELPGFGGIECVSVAMRSSVGDTPLHIAAVRGDGEAWQVLLDAGADPNAPGEEGYTPAHEAVEQGHFDVARLLLRSGASPEARNGDGQMVIELARMLRGEDAVLRLTEI